jgi:hypothetical protein
MFPRVILRTRCAFIEGKNLDEITEPPGELLESMRELHTALSEYYHVWVPKRPRKIFLYDLSPLRQWRYGSPVNESSVPNKIYLLDTDPRLGRPGFNAPLGQRHRGLDYQADLAKWPL